MATNSSWSKEFDCTADKLFGIITSGEFHRARSDLLDNPSADFKETERTESRLKFEVHCVEYAKGVMGVDKSKTEKSVTRYDCDLKNRKIEWFYDGPKGQRVKVWGDMAVTETSGGARVRQNFNVDIKIPLVGGKIEKIVAKETAKFWPRYEKLLTSFVEK
jgi:hypothetical protein